MIITEKVVIGVAEKKASTNIQKEVDRYLELHEQIAELNKELKGLRDSVRGHMLENDIPSIKGTHGKQVYFQHARASNSTARYTDYELKDVMAVLDGQDLKKVTEIRINADKLKGIASVLPEETVKRLEAVKVVKEGTPRFSVKK